MYESMYPINGLSRLRLRLRLMIGLWPRQTLQLRGPGVGYTINVRIGVRILRNMIVAIWQTIHLPKMGPSLVKERGAR